MYPFNASPGSRPSAPVFATFGDAAGVDTRHGQFLLGFDLEGHVPSGLGPESYLIRRARLSVTVSRDQSFLYDPTHDPVATYLDETDPDHLPDPDPGRPVELFGAGFRNGYTAGTFLDDSPFGGTGPGERHAYAVGHDRHGAWVDIGNHVGKSDPAFPVFEVHPFALGRTDVVSPGDPVPAGTTLHFDFHLGDPFVLRYLQEACDTGRLRLVITSLHSGALGGAPAWPDFFTAESVLGEVPRLELDGTAVRPDLDTDTDGLPDDWEEFHFGDLRYDADADPDGDGASNGQEWRAGTDPTDPRNRLAITLASPSPDVPSWTVRLNHAAGRRYLIETSADLQAWTTVADPIWSYDHARGLAAWNDPADSAEIPSARFFRVRLP